METASREPRTRSAARQRKPAASAHPETAPETAPVTSPVTSLVTSKTEENDGFIACNEFFCNITETAENYPQEEPFADPDQPPTVPGSDDPEDSASSSITLAE